MSGLLSDEEYTRRKLFVQEISTLTHAEYIEIVRILRAHKYTYSENSNGVFFNAATIPQDLFEELQKFLQFTKTNRASIEDRSSLFHTLGVEPLSEKEKLTMDATIEDHPSLGKKTIR